MQFDFVHLGRPTPKGRPRFTRHGGIYTPRTTASAEQDLLLHYIGEGGPEFRGPIGVALDFYVDRTEISIWDEEWDSPLRGDIDNYEKLVLDALDKTAYQNDRQIVHLLSRKL